MTAEDSLYDKDFIQRNVLEELKEEDIVEGRNVREYRNQVVE